MNPARKTVGTRRYIEAALENPDAESAEVFSDNHGNSALVAYTPVDIYGNHWSPVAKIDQDETFAPIVQMTESAQNAKADLQRNTWLIAVVAVAIIAVGAYFVAAMITGPVKKVATVLDVVAGGDYSQKAEVQTKGEIGRMAGSLNVAIDAPAAA